MDFIPYLATLTFVSYLWVVYTGVTMLVTSVHRGEHFDLYDVWTSIRSAAVIPVMLLFRSKKNRFEAVPIYPSDYAGTWLTTTGSLMFSGLLLLWLLNEGYAALGPRVALIWCGAQILDNMGKSVFHVKAIRRNLEGARECDSTVKSVPLQL